MVLTNGCGGLDPAWSPGTPVLIRDHINLTGASPLHGAHFVDLTDLYSARLRTMCRTIDPSLPEGVYCQFRGPMYETPAEIGMVAAMGGTLVGMSTALEAIVARSLGMEILGLSLVTNAAAGMTGEPSTTRSPRGQAAATRMGDLLARSSAPSRTGPIHGPPRHGWSVPRPGPRPPTRSELERLIETNDAELADCFAGRLHFGTAGLRGHSVPDPTA